MDILFANRKLQRQCSVESECIRKWGNRCGRLVMKRLSELAAMDNLSVARALPQIGCHELKADKRGRFAGTLEQPYRLIFEPADEPPSLKKDGGCDWGGVKRIRVLEVVDYH